MFDAIITFFELSLWTYGGKGRQGRFDRIGCFIGLSIIVAVVLALGFSIWMGGD